MMTVILKLSFTKLVVAKYVFSPVGLRPTVLVSIEAIYRQETDTEAAF